MKTFALNSDGVLGRYDYLWQLTQDRWAWEYVRRNGKLRSDAELRSETDLSVKMGQSDTVRLVKSRVPQRLAQRWGLLFMPDPNLNALESDAVWNKHVFPDQLEVNCSPRAPDQVCNIWNRMAGACAISHYTDQHAREFLLMRCHGSVIQVRCTGVSLLGLEPVRMKLTISDISAYERKLKIQKAALAVLNDEPEPEGPLWTKTTQILRNGLVALDCLDLGMNRRDIAVVLYGKDTVEAEWNEGNGTLKDSIKYTVKKAQGLRDGGYLAELLGAQLDDD